MTTPTEPRALNLLGRLALRPREAAQVLGISDRKLRELLPRLPHVREGGTVLIPVAGLARWLEDGAKGQAAKASREDATAQRIADSIRRSR